MATNPDFMIATRWNVTPGTILRPDGDFDCMAEGKEVVVEGKGEDLFVPCSHGRHYLDGQLNERDIYVGFSIAGKSA